MEQAYVAGVAGVVIFVILLTFLFLRRRPPRPHGAATFETPKIQGTSRAVGSSSSGRPPDLTEPYIAQDHRNVSASSEQIITARELLESLQLQAYGESGRSGYAMGQYQSIVSEYVADQLQNGPLSSLPANDADYIASLVPKTLPTVFEDPRHYIKIHFIVHFMKRYVDSYARSAPSLFQQVHIPGSVLIGTLPLDSVNAMVVFLEESDELLITFRAGLFEFIEDMTNLITSVIPSSIPLQTSRQDRLRLLSGLLATDLPQVDLERHLNSNPEIIDAFAEIVVQYAVDAPANLIGGHVKTFDHIKHSWPDEQLTILQHCVLAFALGHEYGHMIAGHLLNDKKLRFTIGSTEVSREADSWNSELVADLIGESLTSLTIAEFGLSSEEAYVIATYFFSIVDLLDRTIAMARTKNEINRPMGSHPPPFVRRFQLQPNGLREDSEQAKIKAVRVMQTSKTLEYVIETLWARARSKISRTVGNSVGSRAWIEIDAQYPGGVDALPYEVSAPVDVDAREDRVYEREIGPAERCAFEYGWLRSLVYLAPLAMRAGEATENDLEDMRRDAQARLAALVEPSERRRLQRRQLSPNELFATGEQALKKMNSRIRVAADIGSLAMATRHLANPSAREMFEGMASQIDRDTFRLAYITAPNVLPDDLHVCRAVADLCSYGIAKTLPPEELVVRSRKVLESYYLRQD